MDLEVPQVILDRRVLLGLWEVLDQLEHLDCLEVKVLLVSSDHLDKLASQGCRVPLGPLVQPEILVTLDSLDFRVLLVALDRLDVRVKSEHLAQLDPSVQ